MSEFGDKSHEATPHRRQQAREQGQVARSQDLTSALVLVAAILIVFYFGRDVCQYLVGVTELQLGTLEISQYGVTDATVQLRGMALSVGQVVMPILALVFVVALIAQLSQVGILFLPQKVALDFSHIDPLRGLRRIFSASSAVRLFFGIIKIIVVLTVAGWCLWNQRGEILSATLLPSARFTTFLIDITFWTCLKAGSALLILALLDYGYQYWSHERDIRMTDQEMREEMKTLQGDPQIMARRRAVQRQLVLNRLSSIVPAADFIVTNPTELAIAIRYDFQTMAAPTVIAKGAGVLAQRIRRLALENHIPVVERKELARALYQQVEINQAIPTEQYAAVAEILRYVYQLKGKKLPGVAA